MEINGKRTLVLGLAREGVALARYLHDHGATVTVTDSAPRERLAERIAALPVGVRVVAGDDPPVGLHEVDTLFVSPGVPPSHPLYAAARTEDVPVESMTTLFFDRCPGRIVGVTGSSGKTTTTSLIGHILKTAARDAVVGGNIGAPMIDLLPSIEPDTTVVLELSSFQLEILRRSPQVAVLTNISPNHLDRHGTMEEYVAAKTHLVRHQTTGDHAVLPVDDPCGEHFRGLTPAHAHWFGTGDVREGACVRSDVTGTVHNGAFEPVLPIADIPLLGSHNVLNVLAAIAATDLLGVTAADTARAVRSYRAPAHRLQVVGRRAGVTYVDDSIATTPDRACVALDAIAGPILLLAGGRDKRLPWTGFATRVARRARAVFLIGEAAPMIERELHTALECDGGILSADRIGRFSTLEAAVGAAAAQAQAGDTVLLSPGCTSYDMFTDYEERGARFAAAVEALDAA